MKLMFIPGAMGCPGGTRGTLQDVRVDTNGDIWVCGWRDDAGAGGAGIVPFTARWTGTAWVVHEPNDSPDFATQLWRTSWGTSNDGWTAGDKIWHWSGSAWVYSASLAFTFIQPQITAVDSTHVYTGVYTNAGNPGGLNYNVYNGTTWSGATNGITDATGERFPLDAFNGGTSGDVWVCGARVAGGSDTIWAEPLTGTHTSPVLAGSSGQARRGWANASNDLWVAGADGSGTQYYRYQGSGWSAYSHSGGIAAGAQGAHGVAGDLWEVGSELVSGVLHARMYHFDGLGWTQWFPDVDYPGGELLGVWRVANDNVWACGRHLFANPACPYVMWVLHYDGDAWRTVPL